MLLCGRESNKAFQSLHVFILILLIMDRWHIVLVYELFSSLDESLITFPQHLHGCFPPNNVARAPPIKPYTAAPIKPGGNLLP